MFEKLKNSTKSDEVKSTENLNDAFDYCIDGFAMVLTAVLSKYGDDFVTLSGVSDALHAAYSVWNEVMDNVMKQKETN